jgi:glycosyltransferase involved in cell wall biosynthesis
MLDTNLNYTFVCCGYNCQQWISRSLNSMLNQEYKNFKIVCIDAKSNDGSYEILKDYELKYSNIIKIHKNESRKYQIENTKLGVSLADPKSIIVTVDLDDWLPHENVLDRLNSVYFDENIWMTYGLYCHHPYADVSFHYHDYPEEVKNLGTFKMYPKWLASHLRTFKKELFLSIPEADLKDKNGNYYEMAGDCAFMYPMLELARERTKFINDVLYVYNRTNPISDDKVNLIKQETSANEIKLKKINERLASL